MGGEIVFGYYLTEEDRIAFEKAVPDHVELVLIDRPCPTYGGHGKPESKLISRFGDFPISELDTYTKLATAS